MRSAIGRVIIVSALVVGILIAAGALLIATTMVKFGRVAHESSRQFQVGSVAVAVMNEVAKCIDAIDTLSGERWLARVIAQHLGNEMDTTAFLNGVSAMLRASQVYVLDASGTVVASSDTKAAPSFYGKNYAFRPYFTEAMQGRRTIYPAVGVTTKERGIYFSAPIIAQGETAPVGVLVIKASFAYLDRFFLLHAEQLKTLWASPDGVVIAASDHSWILKTVAPLEEAKRRELAQSKQFAGMDLLPLPFRVHATTVKLDDVLHRVYMRTVSVPGWTLYVLFPEPGWQELLLGQKAVFIIAMLLYLACLLVSAILWAWWRTRVLAHTLEASKTLNAGLLASIACELRTPLNSLKGFLSLLRRTKLDESQCGYVRAADESAEIIVRFVEDVDALLSVTEKKTVLTPERFILMPLLESSIKAVSAQAAAKDLVFDVCAGDKMSGEVVADRRFMTILFDHLFSFVVSGSASRTCRCVCTVDTSAAVARLDVAIEGVPADLAQRLCRESDLLPDVFSGGALQSTVLSAVLINCAAAFLGGKVTTRNEGSLHIIHVYLPCIPQENEMT